MSRQPDSSILGIQRIVNQLRRERGLPSVTQPNAPTPITRALLHQIAVDAWKKYPQSLSDPHYQLGELTLALVDQEIRIRVNDLRRGVVPKKVSLNQYLA